MLDSKIIAICNKNKFDITEEGSFVVNISQKISKTNVWTERLEYDGTNEGLVKSLRELIDNFDVSTQLKERKYKKLIELYDDLDEEFETDDLTNVKPVEMFGIKDILAMLS